MRQLLHTFKKWFMVRSLYQFQIEDEISAEWIEPKMIVPWFGIGFKSY